MSDWITRRIVEQQAWEAKVDAWAASVDLAVSRGEVPPQRIPPHELRDRAALHFNRRVKELQTRSRRKRPS